MTQELGEEQWTHRMFVENAELYLPFLEDRTERAVEEVEALHNVLQEQGVPAGGRVLDLACGIGRHSILLAQSRYRVTGVDISPLFIERARERAAEAGVDVRFIVGDGLRISEVLAGAEPFDATINMFTSHGYYGRESDVSMFRQVRNLSAPGAILIVNAANRDRFMSAFGLEGTQTAGDMLIMEHR